MNFPSKILLEWKNEAAHVVEKSKDEEVVLALIDDIEEARALLKKILKNAKYYGFRKHIEWVEEYFGEKK